MCLRAVMFLFVCVPIVYGDQPSSAPDKYTETTLKEVESLKPAVVNGASIRITEAKFAPYKLVDTDVASERLKIDWELKYEGPTWPRNFRKPIPGWMLDCNTHYYFYVKTAGDKIVSLKTWDTGFLPFLIDEPLEKQMILQMKKEKNTFTGEIYFNFDIFQRDVVKKYIKEFPDGLNGDIYLQIEYENEDRSIFESYDFWTGKIKSNSIKLAVASKKLGR